MDVTGWRGYWLSPRWSRRLQPLVQVVASIATAVFPLLLAVLVTLPGGLSLAAVLLMLLGTQWYILFNVIAGAMAIPSDLREATTVYHVELARVAYADPACGLPLPDNGSDYRQWGSLECQYCFRICSVQRSYSEHAWTWGEYRLGCRRKSYQLSQTPRRTLLMVIFVVIINRLLGNYVRTC